MGIGSGANKIKTKPFKQTKESLVIMHQNIRGLANKTDELLCSLLNRNIRPQIICLSEHYMTGNKLSSIKLPNYVLGTSFARSRYLGGGVCIYIKSDIKFTSIDLTQYCDEKNIEICSLKINIDKSNILVLCVYRSPSGNFDYFIKKMEKVLNFLHKTKTEFIITGDFNVNFLNESERKTQLLLLLNSFNLFNIVQQPTRITQNNSSLIDNIFIDNKRKYSYEVFQMINGLSDHDAQCLIIKKINNLNKYKMKGTVIRIVNKDSIVQFQNEISKESWEKIYQSNEVNEAYNKFLNTYLLIYESCFLKKSVSKKDNDTAWITIGICTSCRRKEFLYILSKNQSNAFKIYYKTYCSILRRVIREAKRLHYNRLIVSAEDRIKATWNIINRETGRKNNNNKDTLPKIFQVNTSKVSKDEAAHNFNKFFLP